VIRLAPLIAVAPPAERVALVECAAEGTARRVPMFLVNSRAAAARVAEHPRRAAPGPGRPVRPEEDAGFPPGGTAPASPTAMVQPKTCLLRGPVGRSDMLELRGLTRRYGDLVALDDLSFTVAEGQMFGFVGPNGAGETTAMRIVLGVLEPDAGEVRWRGRPMNREMRQRIGYLPEDHGQTFLQ
jgi:ABC-type glutathione transport system ATPase component